MPICFFCCCCFQVLPPHNCLTLSVSWRDGKVLQAFKITTQLHLVGDSNMFLSQGFVFPPRTNQPHISASISPSLAAVDLQTCLSSTNSLVLSTADIRSHFVCLCLLQQRSIILLLFNSDFEWLGLSGRSRGATVGSSCGMDHPVLWHFSRQVWGQEKVAWRKTFSAEMAAETLWWNNRDETSGAFRFLSQTAESNRWFHW